MKYRTALVTAASIAVVVLAASVALAANFGILTSGTASGAPNAGEIGSFSLPAATTPEPAAASVGPVGDAGARTTTNPAKDLIDYTLGDAGTVTLERVGNQLQIAAIAPKAGWQAVPLQQGALVQIGFVSGDGAVLGFLAAVGPDGSVLTQLDDLAQPAPLRHGDDDHGREFQGGDD